MEPQTPTPIQPAGYEIRATEDNKYFLRAFDNEFKLQVDVPLPDNFAVLEDVKKRYWLAKKVPVAAKEMRFKINEQLIERKKLNVGSQNIGRNSEEKAGKEEASEEKTRKEKEAILKEGKIT